MSTSAYDFDRAGKRHPRGWNDDHRAEVFLLMDDLGVRREINDMVHYAYDYGYEHPSDGISFPLRWYAQLGFQQFNMKHPIGVMHDCLTREGFWFPFVPKELKDETAVRVWGNNEFGRGLWDCGNWFRSYSWALGLDMFGYPAWHKYREMEVRGDFSHIMNKAIIPAKGNAT